MNLLLYDCFLKYVRGIRNLLHRTINRRNRDKFQSFINSRERGTFVKNRIYCNATGRQIVPRINGHLCKYHE